MHDEPTVRAGAPTRPGAGDEGDELVVGSTFGRFRVVAHLGAGGMGVVVAAHDPTLDRKVAIKLVHPSSERDDAQLRTAELRMVREARAMAKLAHPNVVAVHEVGVDARGVFLVMELVEGGTLADWLREPRPWRAVVERFVAAGRGLAAAHAAGLVHRDFKPSNVLVGADGRVRVTDFGLVAAARGPDHPAPAPAVVDDGHDLTSGTILGTPQYMSPEQHTGDPVDPRADQWAFCASLYEALYREHPFPYETRAALVLAVCDGVVPTPREPRDVPPRLLALVRRGMALAPSARFPSMTALLEELERDPARTRRRAAAGVGVVALAGAAAFGWLHDRGAVPAPRGLCAEAEPGWAPGARETARGKFTALRGAAGADAFTRADARLGGYLAAWRTARGTACTAPDDTPAYHARMACLARIRAEVGALTDVFAAAADPVLVDGAVAAVASLPPVAACAHAGAAGPAVPAAQRAQVDAVDAALRRVEALYRAGLVRDAIAAAEEALARAEASGIDLAIGRAALAVGRARERATAYADAERDLRRAAQVAAAAGDDATVAEAWTTLLWVVSRLSRSKETLELAPLVEAAITRAGDDPRLRAELALATGSALIELGRYDEATPVLARSLAVWDELDPENPAAARVLVSMSNVARYRGDVESATASLTRALALREAAFGPDHVSLSPVLVNLGNLALDRGDLVTARSRCERSLAIAEASGSAADTILRCLGNARAEAGELALARDFLERSLATAPLDRQPYARLALADLELSLGEAAAALPRCEAALAQLGAHTDRPRAVACLGRALIALGRGAEAVAPLTEALAQLERDRGRQRDHADLRFALAQATWRDRAARPRARELAELARADYQAINATRRLAAVDAWLAER